MLQSFSKKTIFTGFMPNMDATDVRIAISFFLPWKWSKIQKGIAVNKVEQKLRELFPSQQAITFDSGRSALYFAVKALDLQSEDEIIVQAYTCAVVSNSVLWNKVKIVYADIGNDFNVSLESLRSKITPRTKALIVQHTFGIPAPIDEILQIAKEHNIKVIEDCAHVIGGTYKSKKLGEFGDITMLSFGTDKVISCGRGGALLTKDDVIYNKLKFFQSQLQVPPLFVTLKQLFTFFLFFIGKPLYHLGIGKWLLGITKKFHLLTRIIDDSEKKGDSLPFYPSLLPNALAQIVLYQLDKLEALNNTRKKWTKKYFSELKHLSFTLPPENDEIIYLRFPLLEKNPAQLHAFAKSHGIILGDWYNAPIAPKDIPLEVGKYKLGMCPQAEKMATQSLNLPTQMELTEGDFNRIINVLKRYDHQRSGK